jgi:hypothetical protein
MNERERIKREVERLLLLSSFTLFMMVFFSIIMESNGAFLFSLIFWLCFNMGVLTSAIGDAIKLRRNNKT